MIACDKNNFLTVESTKIYFFFQNFDQKMLPTLLLESKVRKVCDEHSLHSVARMGGGGICYFDAILYCCIKCHTKS